MLDASAKLPSGLLSGNVVTLGSFDQCLYVESTSSEAVKGKYCFGSVKVKVSLRSSLNSFALLETLLGRS